MAARINGLRVPQPRAWSPQQPHLHTLTVWLSSPTFTRSNGNNNNNATSAVDAVTVRFGLRAIDIGPSGQLLLNGQPLRLRGVNRHTMWPSTGSSLTIEQLRRDLELLRLLGINYVRGAHYPQDQRFLDLCDEAGILVWEETQGSGVAMKHLNSAPWMRHQLRALHAMVSASYNHPSVIIHAFFNEGPSELYRACRGYRMAAEAIRSRAPRSHRLVSWASSAKSHDRCMAHADVVAYNDYPGWYFWSGLSAAVAWREHAAMARASHPSKPFLICETGAGALYEWEDGRSFPRQLLPDTYVRTVGGDGVFKRATQKGRIEIIRGQPSGMWSQTYQSTLLTSVVAEAFSNANISGFSLWQFADVKADDDAIRACGPCELDKASSLDSTPISSPHDCAAYTSACGFPFTTSRPAGLNHKGLVDFWRRPKAAFWALSHMFAAEKRRERLRPVVGEMGATAVEALIGWPLRVFHFFVDAFGYVAALPRRRLGLAAISLLILLVMSVTTAMTSAYKCERVP